jgi:RNA polymerase sigma-70 factor (ECF subfamily)
MRAVPESLVRSTTWDMRAVARMRAGDDSALGELYDAHASYVYGLACRITANPALAEEITQEVFVHVWQHADRIDPSAGSVRGYLGVLAHRRSVDLVRNEQSRRNREARETHRAPLAAADITEAAVALCEAKVVRAALDALPAEQRAVIIRVYLDGESYHDVARTLGIPEGTAKSRGRLGLRKLSATLEAQGVTP